MACLCRLNSFAKRTRLSDSRPTWSRFNEHEAAQRAEVRLLTNYFARVRQAVTGDRDVILMGDFNENVGAPDSLGRLLAAIPGLVSIRQKRSPPPLSGGRG